MKNKIIIALVLAILLEASFYIINYLPKDSEGVHIVFSVLSIGCTIIEFIIAVIMLVLFFFRKYYNFLLTAFIFFSTIVRLMGMFWTSVHSFDTFFNTVFPTMDLLTLSIMLAVFLFKRDNKYA